MPQFHKLATYSYGQKSCRVKCLGAIYAHTLWKAISPEPLGLQYSILHIWNLCVKTNNLSTFGGLYDPPLKSSYNLKNEEKKIKIVKNRFFFPLAQFQFQWSYRPPKVLKLTVLEHRFQKCKNHFCRPRGSGSICN